MTKRGLGLLSSIYPVQVKKMSAPKYPICHKAMTKHGKTKTRKQRWRCKSCSSTKTHSINSDAKQLKVFLDWLMSRKRQTNMNVSRQAFRHNASKFCKIWALPPLFEYLHRLVPPVLRLNTTK